MKISKKTLLIISGILSISALGFMFTSANRDLIPSPSNAVQHIGEVKFIGENNNIGGTLSNSGNFVKVNSNDFIIGQTGDKQNTVVHNLGYNTYSSILGGIKNSLGGSYDVILGGSGNSIAGTYNTILGGEGNDIKCGSFYTIVGGKNNIITTSKPKCEEGFDFNHYSVIVGGHDNAIYGDYSVIMGNNSSVIGDYSVALGSGSHINGNNSFLWTDGSNTKPLESDNVFVVMAKSGVIINAHTAHSFAKLTLGGPLIISDSDTWSGGVCEKGEGGGTLKIQKSKEGQLCLCSCDGEEWNYISNHGTCLNVCKSTPEPECGTEIKYVCTKQGVEYSGSCVEGKVVEGTGAYFIDKDNVIHRSCQTNDGRIERCSGKTDESDINKKVQCLQRLSSTCIGGSDRFGNSCINNLNLECDPNTEVATENGCERLGSCLNSNKMPVTGNNKGLPGFSTDRTMSRYLPLSSKGGTGIRTCVDNNTSYEAHTCTFSCREGYKCVLINPNSRQSGQNMFRTCKEERYQCYGDYTTRDNSVDKYKIKVTDSARIGTVYKNPEYNDQTFTFLNSLEELEEVVSNNSGGCYNVCKPSSHEPSNKNGAAYKGGECIPNCAYQYGSDLIKTTSSSGGWNPAIDNDNNKRQRKYKKRSEYNQFIQDHSGIDLGIGSENSCIWSCPDDTTPIVIYGPRGDKHAYLVSGEFRLDTKLTEFDKFFAWEPNKQHNNDGSDNLVCRHECGEGKYFNGRRCQTLSPGYVLDKGNENNTITFNNITNYGQTEQTCEDGYFLSYRDNACVKENILLEDLCEEKRIDKPWYKRIPTNNECKACTKTGQYLIVTETGSECRRCEEDGITMDEECTCNDGEIRVHQINKCISKSLTGEAKCNIIKAEKPWYKRIPTTNECKACEPGEYATETGECTPCDEAHNNECTPQPST